MAEERCIFVGRCPIGDSCTKKQRILCKKRSEDEVKAAVKHHLMTSPYHELGEEEAENLVQLLEVEKWPMEFEDEDNQQWWESRKRGHLVAQGYGRGSSSGSGGGGGPGLLVRVGKRPHDEIKLSRVMVQACVDSLKRAKISAESAGQLAAKASRAFHEEANTLQQCAEVLQTYVDAE